MVCAVTIDDIEQRDALGEIRAEGDHLAVTTRSEYPASSSLPPLPGNRATNLAELAPSDALFYAEVRDVGQTIGFYVEQSLLPLASAGGGGLDLSDLQSMLGVPPQVNLVVKALLVTAVLLLQSPEFRGRLRARAQRRTGGLA